MKSFLLFLSILVLGFDAKGQQPGAPRLEALKIAYLTRKLDLSPEEAQRFWPIYNQYSADLRQVRLQSIQHNSPEIELDEQLLNVRKKYNGQFSQALSPEKVNVFFKSEKEFGQFVQKEMERRQMRQQRRGVNP